MADDKPADQSEGNSVEIGELLQQGLDLYGEGEVSTAIAIWRNVLKLDPGNTDAIDFLKSADRRSTPRPDSDLLGDMPAPELDVLDEARALLAAKQLEDALELLRSTSMASDFRLDAEAMIELVRSHLFRDYLESIGDLSGVPTLVAKPEEITKYNLPSDAGFYLSLVDGVTDLENIVTVSGMDGFDALRTTKHLIDLGIVRMQA